MNLKPTDEIVGDLPRGKTRIVEGVYLRKPAVDRHAERLRYEMQPPVMFSQIGREVAAERERLRNESMAALQAIMSLSKKQMDEICGMPHFREQIEAAQRQAMMTGTGWANLTTEALEAIRAVDIWAVPTEPENAATLREHADILTGCTENDPVMDSDRPGIAAMDNTGPAGDPLPADQRDELRDAWRKGSVWGQPPEPPPAPEPPPHNLGVIAPISGRVGGKWGA